MRQKTRPEKPSAPERTMSLEIASAQNAKFKDWRSLLEARGIKKSGRTLISGEKLVNEFLRDRPTESLELLLPARGEFPPPNAQVKTFRLAAALFNELDALGTKAPLLVAKTPVVTEWKMEAPKGLEVILALSDPGNLGALLRSAEAFGARRAILCEECCSPYLPKVTRGACLANFRLPLAKTGSLKNLNVESAFALDMKGEDLRDFQWPEDFYLVLGEEGRGIPAELPAKRLAIPMAGLTESLNAVVAASIAMFVFRSHRS